MKRRETAAVVFFAAFFLRVYHLNLPYLESYNNLTRQSVVGMIVRNFYRHGFNFFYPELDLNGNGPSLFAGEVPVYSYLMALAYRFSGGVHEWAARLVSVAVSMGTLYFLYKLVQKATDEKLALYALVFAAFSPLNLALSRSIQPDAMMLFGSAGALYGLYSYFDSKRPAYFVLSAFFLWLAVASKAHALYLFIPLLFIAWQNQGWRLFRRWENYVYAAFCLTPLIWYFHMIRMGETGQLVYGGTLLYGKGDAYADVGRLFGWRTLVSCAKVFLLHVLTPGGAILFFLGWFDRRKRPDTLFYVWLFSILVYAAVFWPIFIDHSYYQLPFVLPAAYFVAKGFEAAAVSIKKGGKAAGFATAVLAVVTLAGMAHLYKGLYFIPKNNLKILKAGEMIQKFTGEKELVIVTNGTPALLYSCDRKGWEFYPGESTKADFEKLKIKGAAYFVALKPESLKESWLGPYLRENYKMISENTDFIIFHLKNGGEPR